MACQIAARMTMLKNGAGMQWRHLVYSDLPTDILKVDTLLFVGSIVPDILVGVAWSRSHSPSDMATNIYAHSRTDGPSRAGVETLK